MPATDLAADPESTAALLDASPSTSGEALPPSPYRWVVEGLLFAIYAAFGLSWLAYSPLLKDLAATYGVAPKEAADVISLVSISKAFVPLFAAWLAARLGVSRALLLGASLAGLAIVAPLAPSFQALLACRFAFGIGGAIVVTLMGAQVMAWFPKHELALVNGLNNVAVNTGITISMFATVPLAGALGNQRALLALGTLNVALALAWGLLGRGPREGEAPTAAAAAPKADSTSSDARAASDASVAAMARRRETWCIAMAFTGALGLYLALNTWLPTYYQEAFGLTRAQAAQVTALFNLVGIPTALAGGVITTRLGLRRPLIIAAGLVMPVAAMGMVLATTSSLRVLSAALLGASFFLYVAPLFTVPTELPGMDAPRVAAMTGVVFSVAYIASYIAPKVVGLLREHTGSYVPGFALFATTSLLLALGGYLLPETGPGRGARP